MEEKGETRPDRVSETAIWLLRTGRREKKNKLVDGTGILQMKCARYQCKSDLFSEWKSIRKKSPKFISFGYYVSIEKKSMYPKSIHGRAISRISLELISTIWAN